MGYTIEERDSALQFDEEYLLQMYINFITNYTYSRAFWKATPRKNDGDRPQKKTSACETENS